jgi:hypothetical protein
MADMVISAQLRPVPCNPVAEAVKTIWRGIAEA